jgi:hypothetical protein
MEFQDLTSHPFTPLKLRRADACNPGLKWKGLRNNSRYKQSWERPLFIALTDVLMPRALEVASGVCIFL